MLVWSCLITRLDSTPDGHGIKVCTHVYRRRSTRYQSVQLGAQTRSRLEICSRTSGGRSNTAIGKVSFRTDPGCSEPPFRLSRQTPTKLLANRPPPPPCLSLCQFHSVSGPGLSWFWFQRLLRPRGTKYTVPLLLRILLVCPPLTHYTTITIAIVITHPFRQFPSRHPCMVCPDRSMTISPGYGIADTFRIHRVVAGP